MILFLAIPSLGWGENAQLAYVLLSLTTVEAGALVSTHGLFLSNDLHQRLL